MSKIEDIYNGWSNYIRSDELSPEELNRAIICRECPQKKYSAAIKALVKDEVKDVEGFICNECKCPLSAKIRSKNNKCPLNKW